MDGNDKKKVKKPCAKCKGLKQFCTHFTMEYPVSYKTACEKCRGKHDKCTHNARAGGAGAGQPKRTEVAPKPAAGTARMSYAEAVRAAQRAPAAAPERALTAQQREAAEAFMAPEYEVMYLDEKDVPGYNPDLR
jgi:DnaJ-class molecular chaperone